jgi:hypothetical protein
MLNLKTKHINKSRDVLCLNKSFGVYNMKLEGIKNKFDEKDGDNDDEVIEEIRKKPIGPVDAEEKSLQPYIQKEFDSCFLFLFDWNY